MVNKIKIRLSILILSLITIISIMTISISGEVKKISAASEDYKDKLIRFHVIANSDSEEDQNLKLKVRDAIINYLQPKLLESESIEESELIIKKEYDELEKISKNIILENGYDYDVKVGIDYSKFPTKQYSNVVLPAGEYKALRIIIGEGKGKNWWCVMFPSLCFVDESKNSVDSSYLKEEIENIEPKNNETINEDKEKNKESSNVNNGVKFKFKIVEVINNIFD